VEFLELVVVFALSLVFAWAGARITLAIVFVYLLKPSAARQPRTTAASSADAAAPLVADLAA
jgi:hypothetical protein